MTDTDLAWAAGIIDGEGCISVNYGTKGWKAHKKSRCVIKINVSNTDPRMPVRMRDIFELGSVCASHGRALTGRRPLYEWCVVSRQAKSVLEAVMPYLVIKSEQAEVALAIAATMQEFGGRGAIVPLAVAEERLALQARLKLLKQERPTLEEVS